MPPFQPPVVTEEYRESYVQFPQITVGTKTASQARLYQHIIITDGVEFVQNEDVTVIWGKTKANLVSELTTQKTALEAEKTAQISKLDALIFELNK